MNIKTWRDPYDAGFNTTNPKAITIEPGLTVLVGCNGAGKTTLLLNIKEHCRNNKIPCHMYNNLHDGASSSIGSMISGSRDMPCDNIGLAVSMWTASEGEAIRLNIGRQSTLYKNFLQSGKFKDRRYRMSSIFNEDKEQQEIKTNIRVLLFDATDSGLSIDNICDIKAFFNKVLTEAKADGLELYIIISANEYELCNGEKCFDVNKGNYLEFKDYEDYKKFILNSRKNKEKRIDKQIKWQEKQKDKEKEQYEKLKAEVAEKKAKIIADLGDKELTWKERDELFRLDRKLEEFRREARFLRKEDMKD